MVGTDTYEITLPRRVAAPLAKKAMSDKSTLSEIILRIIEEHEDSWKLENDAMRFDWGQFEKDAEAYTKAWADVDDPVGWVRNVRG